MTLVTVGVIALAVVGAVLYNRHVWRPRQARDPTHSDGLTARSPAETEFIVRQIAPEAPAPLPCDDAGLPADAPDFEPARIALG